MTARKEAFIDLRNHMESNGRKSLPEKVISSFGKLKVKEAMDAWNKEEAKYQELVRVCCTQRMAAVLGITLDE